MEEALIQRDLLPAVLQRIGRREIIAIRGPRQSGKSTLLAMLKKELIKIGVAEDRIVYLTFEDPNVLDEFVKDPVAYVSTFAQQGKKYYVFIDEVQYDKEAGRRLKLLYDRLSNVKFLVTGSSTLDINKLTAFLVGRVFLYELLPLSFGEYLRYEDRRLYGIFEENHKKLRSLIVTGKRHEFGDVSVNELKKRMEQYILFGGFPAVVKSANSSEKIEILKNIYITYLEKDIPGIFGITDTQTLRKVILNLALNMGNLIDYNNVAMDTGLYYVKLIKYLSILESTYVVRTVAPFYRNRITELKKNKKIYFIDPGLRNYIMQNFNSMEKREDGGRLIENFVCNELSLIASPTDNVNYWRTSAKAEVDFVFNSGRSILPIEVKQKSMRNMDIGRSLHSFINSYKPKQALFLSGSNLGRAKIEGTEVFFVNTSYL